MVKLICGFIVLLTPVLVAGVQPEDHYEVTATATNVTIKDNVGGGQSRIVNGDDAIEGRYPYSVSLQQTNGFHFCGGSLIAPELVLCAAHCQKSLDEMVAVINPYNKDDPQQVSEKLKLVDLIVHKDYGLGADLNNDVMLLKLASPSANHPVNLNTNSAIPEKSGDPLTVIGWGTLVAGRQVLPSILQETEVTYMLNAKCKTLYARLHGSDSVTDNMLCVLAAGTGSCQGDSGGPLLDIRGGSIESDIQVGIVSWGEDCGKEQFPGVYTRISSAWPWIEEAACMMTHNLPHYFDCSNVVDRPPTASPTATASPTSKKTQLLLRIKLDDYPEELSWSIRREDGEIIDERSYRTYTTERGVYFESISVDDGGTFYLTLNDRRDDGICCQYGQGSIFLYLGSEVDPSKLLAYSDGEYDSVESIQFTASPTSVIADPETVGGGTGDPDGNADGLVTVKIKTDLFPVETSWTIERLDRQKVFEIRAGDLYEPNTEVLVPVVLNLGQTYRIVVRDEYGDGMCCSHGDGEVTVYFGSSVAGNMLLARVDGQFQGITTTTFVVREPLVNNGGAGGGFGCFPRDAMCQVEGRGSVPLGDIQLGDKVLVDGGVYEQVYSFGHYAPQATGEFIQLVTPSTSLTLSRDHLVFVEGGSSVPASTIKIGDNLKLVTGDVDAVKEIRTVVRQGVYAPFTRSGTLIVDGVKASNFIAFQSSSTLYVAGFNTHLSYHFLAHAFEAPHRAWCLYMWSCQREKYGPTGISLWVDAPHEAVRWYFERKSILLDTVALPILLGIVGILAYPTLAACAYLLVYIVAVQKHRASIRTNSKSLPS